MDGLAADPIGQIGDLEIGGFYGSDLTMISAAEGKVPPVLLTPQESEVLESLARTARSLADGIPAGGGGTPAGGLPPQPTLVRVFGAHAAVRVVALQLRLGDAAAVAQVRLEDFEALVTMLGMARRAGQVVPEPEPTVVRAVEPERLILDEGVLALSPLTRVVGAFREPLAAQELAPGDHVRVRASLGEPKVALRVDVLDDRPAPPPLDPAWGEPLTKLAGPGAEADRRMHQGEFLVARQQYLRLLEEMWRSGKLDLTAAAKLTLGILLCHVHAGQLDDAVGVWTAKQEQRPFGLGIWGLEQGQSSEHDLLVYRMVSGFLNSMAAEPAVAARNVRLVMEGVCEQARGTPFHRMALSNWRLHLREVFGEEVPADDLAPWTKEVQSFGRPVVPQAIWFPPPYAWTIDWTSPREATTVGAEPPKKKSWLGRLFGR